MIQGMNSDLTPILDYLLKTRGFDFSGYHPDMLARRIEQRLTESQCGNLIEYQAYIQLNADEVDKLLDVITINVSRFFRDPLTFEFLAERILPAIVIEKVLHGEDSLRIWSAGCAMGEEPYSVAILVHELIRKEGMSMNIHIFATDIDAKALKKASKAVYPLSSIENLKHGILTRYFKPDGDSFRLIPDIKDHVTFSHYDMLEKKTRGAPGKHFWAFRSGALPQPVDFL